MKKFLAMLLALTMVLSLAACGGEKAPETTGAPVEGTEAPVVEGVVYNYTYKTATTALASNWNPHSWEMNIDSTVLSFLSTPFVSQSIEDSVNGVYQWVYLAAESAENQADLEKYMVKLPEGQTAADTTSGFVFEIKLNPDMKWEDGTPINADSYIYSMQQLLNPDMKNYRANLYYAGESAVAGGNAYYYSKDEGMYVPYTDVYASLADAIAAGEVYINCWDFWGAEGYIDAAGNEAPQYVSITCTLTTMLTSRLAAATSPTLLFTS